MTVEKNPDLFPYCEVVFPLPVRHAFTYLVPDHLKPVLKPGHRVLAPFGRRRLTGYLVHFRKETEITELKEIEDILDEIPILSAEMLRLTKWVADYYLASWGEVIEAALPAGINLESQKRFQLAPGLDREQILQIEQISRPQRELLLLLNRKGKLSMNQLQASLGQTNLNYNLIALERKGWIVSSRELIEPRVKIKYRKFVQLAPELSDEKRLNQVLSDLLQKHSPQAELLQELKKHPEGLFQSDLLQRARVSNSCLQAARKNHLLVIEKKEVIRDYYRGMSVEQPEPIVLNTDQRQVLQEIIQHLEREAFMPVLLYGVTGSGKTQVYIETLLEVRRRGRNAIVLVPEIALTPQTVSRFRAHFGEEIAVLHSRMSDGERYDSWRKIRAGKVHIVIGPRSAIFAPLENIGLIVVDEEQEASYKQVDQSPRYHARDVALVRGQMNQAIVILGSATPSIESFYNARTRKYRLLKLPSRVQDLPLPRVEIVDMRKEGKKNKKLPPPIFSEALIQKIAEKLTRQEQVILLQNRRGFSTFILCRECGYVEHCINCNITLTYHLFDHRLRCHYCDYQRRAPEICPHCGGVRISYRGVGTQRVEEEIKFHFPHARVVRMDLDTTSRKGAHDRILHDFRERQYDILLGTQMVAKGLDLPGVSLVGVISADTTLQLPDFRASERTFQLLTQVAGRSGRKSAQGEVIIQTYSPYNHSILFAKKHDYLRFFAKEIQERKELAYPPFSRLIVIEFRQKEEKNVRRVSQLFAREFPPKNFYRLLGPAPAPISRLKDEYRYHLILKYDHKLDPLGKQIRQEIQNVLQRMGKRGRHNVKVSIDVDPTDLF